MLYTRSCLEILLFARTGLTALIQKYFIQDETPGHISVYPTIFCYVHLFNYQKDVSRSSKTFRITTTEQSSFTDFLSQQGNLVTHSYCVIMSFSHCIKLAIRY
jgi:hypothetical protein